MHAYERWRDTIQAARDEAALRRAMRDYAASIPPPILGALPAECQTALGDPDIQGAALTLLQCDLAYRGDPAFTELLHEIAQTFAAASTRINQLGAGESG